MGQYWTRKGDQEDLDEKTVCPWADAVAGGKKIVAHIFAVCIKVNGFADYLIFNTDVFCKIISELVFNKRVINMVCKQNPFFCLLHHGLGQIYQWLL